MAQSPTRRNFLQNTATAAALTTAAGATTCGDQAQSTVNTPATMTYEDLGVRRVINGRGTVTVLGGSVMPAEVVAAMVDAARSHVHFPDLQRKAGAKIAEMIGVPAAMISCGAASAMTCGTAACLHRGDRKKATQLPDVTDIPNEIISQKAHRCGYEAQMWLTGARTVWVETREELEAAISDKTAMMFFLNKAEPKGQIKREEWVEVAKKHDIPTLNDAAADVPPKERLKGYVDEGFDLVVFSGGKGLTGPQASGLLLGREDLVDAAWLSISPAGGIGRGMKVGKEEIIALVVALERFVALDEQAEIAGWNARARWLAEALQGVPGLSAQYAENTSGYADVDLSWDEEAIGLSVRDFKQRLHDGEPRVIYDGTTLRTRLLRDGEAQLVAERVQEVFGG